MKRMVTSARVTRMERTQATIVLVRELEVVGLGRPLSDIAVAVLDLRGRCISTNPVNK
jgi:hypothetical protein